MTPQIRKNYFELFSSPLKIESEPDADADGKPPHGSAFGLLIAHMQRTEDWFIESDDSATSRAHAISLAVAVKPFTRSQASEFVEIPRSIMPDFHAGGRTMRSSERQPRFTFFIHGDSFLSFALAAALSAAVAELGSFA